MDTLFAGILIVTIALVVLFFSIISYEIVKGVLADIKDTLCAIATVCVMIVLPSLIVIWLGAGLIALGLLNAFTLALLTVVWFVYAWAIQELF